MMQFRSLRAVVLLLLGCWIMGMGLSLQIAAAFSFDLPVNTKQCFTEEVPSDVDIRINYMAGLGKGLGQFIDVHLTLTPEGGANDANRILVWKDEGNTKGSFKQRFSTGGELELCFVSRLVSGVKAKANDNKRPISVEFIVGADPRAYDKVATTDKLRPIQVQLRVLEDAIRDILGEYQYYKSREQEMRNTNEHMTARIMWAAVIVIIIIAGFSSLQVKQIERYLRKKRMID